MSKSSSSRRSLIRFARASALLAGLCAAPTAAAAEPWLRESLTNERFLAGCIGLEGGTVEVVFEDAYQDEAAQLRQEFEAELLRTGAAREVVSRAMADETDVSCAKPMPGTADEQRRVTVFITLYKDGTNSFSSADIVIRRGESCHEAVLERGDVYPETCGVRTPLTLKPRPRPPSPPKLETVPTPRRAPLPATQAAIALTAASSLLWGTTFALRLSQLTRPEDLRGATVFTSLGTFSASAAAGALWARSAPPSRPLISRSVAGSFMLAAGAITLTFLTSKGTDDVADAGILASAELIGAVGTGLLSSALVPAIQRLATRRRLARRSSLAAKVKG